MRQIYPAIAILLLSGTSKLNAQPTFPEWRGSKMLIPGVWKASPVAVVGEVTNVRPYGEQDVKTLPWPMSPEVHRLYWCEGNFRTIAVVKGELSPTAKKYLWASSQPGCELWDDDPSLIFVRFKTRVWLLREEGGVLRPPFDGGTDRFIGFFTQWDQSSKFSAQQQVGTLLLTPAANSDTLEDYAKYLWDAGDIACELLGRVECVRQIRAIAALGSPVLRENACHFLKAQIGEDCSSKP